MGCDIHAFIEYKHKCDSIGWTVLSESPFSLFRNYQMFGFMAGVRGDVTLFTQRGLPAGVDKTIPHEMEKDNNHSPSWLSYCEFHDCIDEAEAKRIGPEWLAVLAAMRSFIDANIPCRLTFFFDN